MRGRGEMRQEKGRRGEREEKGEGGERQRRKLRKEEGGDN